MSKIYIFSEAIQKQLELGSSAFPSKKQIRLFLKGRFGEGAGMKSDFLFDAKLGRPTSKKVLTQLLLYLQEKQPQFASDCLEEGDWDALTIDELVDRHVRSMPIDYVPRSKKRNVMSQGPSMILGELLVRGNEQMKAGPLQADDIPFAASTLALAAGDMANEDGILAPAKESREIGFEMIGLSPQDVCDLMRAWIRHNPNSIWFKRNQDPTKHLLTMLMPVSDEVFPGIRAGVISDKELTDYPPCRVSSNIIINAASGDQRYRSNIAEWNLLTMLLRQLSLVTTDITKTGLNAISFFASPDARRRLESWHFESVGTRMRRTGLEIAELRLEKTPPPLSLKTAFWACVLFYQSLAHISGRTLTPVEQVKR